MAPESRKMRESEQVFSPFLRRKWFRQLLAKMFALTTKGGGSTREAVWGGGGLTYRPRGCYYYSKLNCLQHAC